MSGQVLFIYNDPIAPEALLGETFTELGFDVDTFEVVPADRPDDPVVEVSFPDPTRYDVIVPLGSRWAVYDERLAWVADEIATVVASIATSLWSSTLPLNRMASLVLATVKVSGSPESVLPPLNVIPWGPIALSLPKLMA